MLRAHRLTIITAAASAATLVAASTAICADAQAPTPSMEELADLAIDGCRNYAAEKKLPPLSLAVVDESGALVRFERQTGASPMTGEAATLKARTALQARSSTADLASQAQDPAVRDALILLHLTTLPGGVPILSSDSSLRGAIGVSGAEGVEEAECAKRALDAVETPMTPSDQARLQLPSQATGLTRAIRRRILDYESAWNRADLNAVLSQYDPSLSAIWQPEFVDYNGYLKSVREMMSSAAPPKIRLKIHTILPLGGDYAVANGHAFTRYADGHELKEIFTIVYKRHGEEWKLVYVHSGFY